MRCNEIDENARQYTYVEFPRHYVWNKGARKWTRRKDQRTVGRINYVPPKSGETYYLRILLNKVRGPTCYEDTRTVNDVVYDTFKETCYAMGLLDDDREYVVSINETYQVASGDYCRSLFVSLITTDSLSCADRIWNETRDILSEDLRHECPTQILDQDEDQIKKVLYNLALAKIEKMLNSSGNSLKNIANMPYPDYEYIDYLCNMMIQDYLSYDMHILQVEHETLFSTMTDEQKCVYNTILEAVDKNEGGTFFLYAYGGTGKTFVSKTLGAALRSRGDIVINFASSGIAALLLMGGRTANSRFSIPINVVEDSFCNIQPDSQLAGLLNESKLIIWDEAPMQHRHCVEAFDRTMNDIIRSDNRDKAFGGKVVVFGGDFRQILPVITKGTRSETVHASLHSSELWRECKVLKLTKNMRLLNCVSHSDLMEVREFAQWILDIGEGKINLPNDGEADVQFPEEVLIRSNYDPIESIVNSLYPSLHQELGNPSYFQERDVLAPTNEEVDAINELVLSKISDSERVYYSSDTLFPDELDDLFVQQVYSPEILNGLKVPGVPNHKLVLKTGVPIMLLRNVDQSKGLYHVPGPDDVDNFITAELPDKNVDPDLYSIVSEFMIHGPCGPNHKHSPCMTQKGQCSKHFPKDFHSETHFDGDGYPRYKIRDDGNFVVKGTTNLDNRYVVPYNKQLLKQYQAHINVEWCNQIESIKYLFKYINKGPDRITISIQDSNAKKSHARDSNSKDEIATYYSCRYLSSCEASWRLFNFDIVHRTPAVYRLQFHLPNHEPIYYDNDEVVENVLLKPSVGTS
ncbi:uncharacterized protein [Rutidosis leptorrhynchoides]|uniref:uncharacterized protein n=1 Tax=Rutidosis leptorrhynchoides TaxID=125765 RepID=UPI003A994377